MDVTVAAFILLLVSLGLLAWVSLAGAALRQVSEAAARQRASAGDRGAQALSRVLGDDRVAASLLLAETGLLLLAALLLEVSLRAGGVPWGGELGAHLGMLVAVVVLGMLAPRTAGLLLSERFAYGMAPAVLRLTRLLAPLSAPLAALTHAWWQRANGPGGESPEPVTAEDIQAAVDLGEESGEVHPEVGRMVDEVMELSQTTVREVMTPRVDIVGVPAAARPEQILEVAIESGFSRLPVYEEDLDQLVGILYVNDLLARLYAGERDFAAGDLARPAVRTLERRRVSDMLREMRERAIHLAIVVDDSGGTEGLVTIEDILEELVGEIADEHDARESELATLASGAVLAGGRTRLEELEEALGLTLPEAEVETVGGLLSSLLGRFPREGESVTWGGVELRVVEVEGQQVRLVEATRLPEEVS